MKALDLMREVKIIAQVITETERLVALVLVIADTRMENRLVSNLDDLLLVTPRRRLFCEAKESMLLSFDAGATRAGNSR